MSLEISSNGRSARRRSTAARPSAKRWQPAGIFLADSDAHDARRAQNGPGTAIRPRSRARVDGPQHPGSGPEWRRPAPRNSGSEATVAPGSGPGVHAELPPTPCRAACAWAPAQSPFAESPAGEARPRPAGPSQFNPACGTIAAGQDSVPRSAQHVVDQKRQAGGIARVKLTSHRCGPHRGTSDRL